MGESSFYTLEKSRTELVAKMTIAGRLSLPWFLGLAFAIFLVSSAAVFAGEDDACAAVLENIRNGMFQQADSALASCSKLTEVEDAVNQMKKKLGEVSTKLTQLKSAKQATPPIEPALQWAQSPEAVFINVKFAHKLDAPACIDLVDPNIEMEESRVTVRAACKGVDKHFKLDLTLFSSIVVPNSSWAMTSVGRGSFTLSKQVAAKWDRLLASREKPKNLHVWWAMQEKFDSALDAMKDTASVPTTTAEQIKAAINPVKEEEDDLTKGVKAAKKRVQEQAKKAKRRVEERAAQSKAKVQKQLDAIEEEETKHISHLDDELKASLAKLDEKFSQLKAKRDAGDTSIVWMDNEKESEGEEPMDGSFLAAAAKVLKRAFGVGQNDSPNEMKDEV